MDPRWRQLRTETIDNHWNQKGTHQSFAIVDHSGDRYFASLHAMVAGALGDLESREVAVGQLRGDAGALAPSREAMGKIAKRMVSTAQAATAASPSDVVVMENLGAIVVRAVPAFLRAMIRDPLIVRATANEQPAGFFVPPRPVRRSPERIGRGGSYVRKTKAKS
jgi:hypothetical protein